MKGQVSLEYIILIGLILIVLTPLFYYGLTKSNESIKYNQAEEAVKTIAGAANNVYSSGLGGKKIVKITIPSGTSFGVSENALILNLSIFGGNTEFIELAKADLVASQSLLDKLQNKGIYDVSVETFKDTDGKIKVLLGGFCGDNICSSTETYENCQADCTSFCPNLVCDSNEDCTCSDCYGQQSVCSINQVCDTSGNGQCVVSAQVNCGDGICTGLVGDNCNDCSSDCPLVTGYSCCPYDPQNLYYVLWHEESCPPIPPSVSNCGDYCVFIGAYNNGYCRQNQAQCTQNNEVYQSGGDSYCSGSPTGDSCCCDPS